MNIANNLGIRNSLFKIINSEDLSSIEYHLAHYLLEHFNSLDKLNIYKMVDETNVSRSSINRFIKELGYKNFLDFKTGFKNQGYSNQKDDFFNRPYSDYIDLLTDEIFEMMYELRKRMNNEELIYMCKKICESKNVVFLSSSTNSGMVNYFQQEFIFMNKIIYSISESYSDGKLLSKLNEDDLIIVFSMSGKLAFANKEYIEKINCVKFLITTNRSADLYDSFDKTYYLSSKDCKDLDVKIYNRYGITYMLDILLNTYSYIYFSGGKE